MLYLGDYPTGQTVYIPWHTFDSNDPSASVTMSGLALADIKVYKNGSVTQRSSTSGFTLLDTDGTDFDSITGIHGISIDTSDNTDAGFWAAGNDYWVVIDNVTVDAATISFIAAIFSIDNRGLLRPTTAQRTLDVTATGAAGIDWGNVENQTTAVDLSGTDIQLCDTVTTNTDMRGTDSAALASVCTEARLAELDAANIPTDLSTIAGYIDTEIGTIITNIAALNDISVADIHTTQMTESYAVDGTAPTIAQALFLIQQMLTEFAISGTTMTTKKLDGTTTAATFTLDDGTNPTSLTRAT